MFSVDQVIAENLPQLERKPLIGKSLKVGLKYLLHEREFQEFQQNYPYVKGVDFAEQVLDYFDFGYCLSNKDRERIPSSGRVVIIANHPIGSLDGLALIKMISEIRSDFKVVANQLLMNIEPLHSLLIPVNNMGGTSRKKSLSMIYEHLESEGALIIFPAGEVSRMSPSGIKDGQWNKGFLKIAKASQSPILPIHIDARNSAFFYALSAIYKPLSTLMLVKEMFGQAHKRIQVSVGQLVPFEQFEHAEISLDTQVKLFKKHLYRVAKGKAGYFKTETAVAHPERRSALKEAIEACEELGVTQDGKVIYLYRFESASPIMREIGRLREVAFRVVGEGTGAKRDIDKFDQDYLHLILWDKNDLEIVGAYRFAEAQKFIEKHGVSGLYTNSLFEYQPAMKCYLKQGLELGRSFVQPKYWGKRSLDYLWFGIGAFIAKNPQYRYLFGPVTISNALPTKAKQMLVYFYNMYFGNKERLAKGTLPYHIPKHDLYELEKLFLGDDHKQDFVTLKHLLANMGVSVPTLYKQYSEVCEKGGVEFLEFNIDPDFCDCIDGLVLVDIQQLKEKKRARYIDSHLKTNDS